MTCRSSSRRAHANHIQIIFTTKLCFSKYILMYMKIGKKGKSAERAARSRHAHVNNIHQSKDTATLTYESDKSNRKQ